MFAETYTTILGFTRKNKCCKLYAQVLRLKQNLARELAIHSQLRERMVFFPSS